jgi:hypothetical protein
MAKLNYKFMTKDELIKWCVDNNQVEWLKEFALKEDEDGNYPTFFEIKKAFSEKFMPDIIPVAKKKPATMYDIIKNL